MAYQQHGHSDSGDVVGNPHVCRLVESGALRQGVQQIHCADNIEELDQGGIRRPVSLQRHERQERGGEIAPGGRFGEAGIQSPCCDTGDEKPQSDVAEDMGNNQCCKVVSSRDLIQRRQAKPEGQGTPTNNAHSQADGKKELLHDLLP